MLIYRVTNKINGKKYVGQTVFSLEKRRRQHINDALSNKDTYHFHNALRKYGPDNFEWTILHKCSIIEELNMLEMYYIRLYNTFEKGYNLTLGGDGVVGFEHSEELKKKMSDALKGSKNPNYGKTFSEETRQKMSDANRGKRLSEGQKKKISETLKGKYVAENNPMYGKHLSEETKRKISEAFKGKNNPGATAIIIDNKCFDTRKEAAGFVGVNPATIRNRILHKTKWLDYKYANKGEN